MFINPATDDRFALGSAGGPVEVIFISMVSIGSLVTVVTLCICCYGRPDDDDDENDEDSFDHLLSEHGIHDADSECSKSLLPQTTGFKLSSQLSRDLSVSKVQPELTRQWSVNKLLGCSRPMSPTSRSVSQRVLSAQSSFDFPDANLVPGLDTTDSAAAAAPSTVTSPPGSNVACLGRIQFQIGYDFSFMTLNLRLLRAENLPAKDFSGTSDPYVKMMLLPDKKHRLVSNIKRRTLNPRWNELHTFEGYPFAKLSDKTLYMQVLDYDRFSRDDPIGEVCLPLKELNLADGETLWRNLEPCHGRAGKLGELQLSLCYQPSPGLITVGIIAARGLIAKDINGLSDPYVKIWMLYNGKQIEKQKTTTKQKMLNPTYNESFVFSVPSERIALTSLVVSVMDRDHIGSNELIGRIILGNNASGPMETKHWNEVFTKPKTVVEQWHVLKDFD